MTYLVLILLIIVILMVYNKKQEHYSSIPRSTDYLTNYPYYSWRAYGHNVYDKCRLGRYPYNYKQAEHPARFNYYLPYFYEYGYGSL